MILLFRNKFSLMVTGLALLIVSSMTMAQLSDSKHGDEAIKAAMSAAEAWFVLVDNQQYAESWEETAEFFKSKVSEEKWVSALSANRKALGKVVSRKAFAEQYRTTMPGAPVGEYVTLQYQTLYENKQSAVVKVSLLYENGNTWRVVGYSIR